MEGRKVYYTHYTVHNSFWMLLETLCSDSVSAIQTRSDLCVPRNETARPRSCICERFIYSHDRSTKELGTTPCKFISGNICFKFSVQCLCRVSFQSSSTVYHFSIQGYGFLFSTTWLLSRSYFPISLLDILLQYLAQFNFFLHFRNRFLCC
jgi:hypothetical protein